MLSPFNIPFPNLSGTLKLLLIQVVRLDRRVYVNDKGDDVQAKQMNDYIDIGIFAADTKNKEGRSQVNPLYLKKYKFNYGPHTITVIVKTKPVRVGIDPYSKLIDRNPNDNMKDL